MTTNHVSEINPGFTKYKLRKRTHEAGYDSMLAAMAFIKLAGNLQRNPAMFTQKVQQPTILAGPHMPPSLFASVMQPLDRRGSPNSEFSNFFYLESETPPEKDEKYIADQGTSLDDTGDRQIISLASRGFLVPRLGTVFWAIYGNKLRVFGTQERMIQVEPQPKVELLVDV
jgi:poly(A)-specific ribonuclease